MSKSTKTVAVPMTAVVQLFDMGNWSSGELQTELEALIREERP